MMDTDLVVEVKKGIGSEDVEPPRRKYIREYMRERRRKHRLEGRCILCGQEKKAKAWSLDDFS